MEMFFFKSHIEMKVVVLSMLHTQSKYCGNLV